MSANLIFSNVFRHLDFYSFKFFYFKCRVASTIILNCTLSKETLNKRQKSIDSIKAFQGVDY